MHWFLNASELNFLRVGLEKAVPEGMNGWSKMLSLDVIYGRPITMSVSREASKVLKRGSGGDERQCSHTVIYVTINLC